VIGGEGGVGVAQNKSERGSVAVAPSLFWRRKVNVSCGAGKDTTCRGNVRRGRRAWWGYGGVIGGEGGVGVAQNKSERGSVAVAPSLFWRRKVNVSCGTGKDTTCRGDMRRGKCAWWIWRRDCNEGGAVRAREGVGVAQDKSKRLRWRLQQEKGSRGEGGCGCCTG
jgi:dienelactone hydrolase